MPVIKGQENIQRYLQSASPQTLQALGATPEMFQQLGVQMPKKDNFLMSMIKGIGSDLGGSVKNMGTAGAVGLSNLFGKDEYADELQNKYYGADSSATDVLQSGLKGGLTLGSYLVPGAGPGASIGKMAAAGAGAGALGSLGKQDFLTGDLDVGKIAKGAAIGGAAAGALGAVGKGLGKLSKGGIGKTAKLGAEQADELLRTGKAFAPNQVKIAINQTLATPQQSKALTKALGKGVNSVDDISRAAQGIGLGDDVVDDFMRGLTKSNTPPATGNWLQEAGRDRTWKSYGVSPKSLKGDAGALKKSLTDVDALNYGFERAKLGAPSLEKAAYLPDKLGKLRGQEIANTKVSESVANIVDDVAEKLRVKANLPLDDATMLARTEMDNLLSSQEMMGKGISSIDPAKFISGEFPIDQNVMFDLTQTLGDDTAQVLRLERLGTRAPNPTQYARSLIDRKVSGILGKANPEIGRLNRSFEAFYRQMDPLIQASKRGGNVSMMGGKAGVSAQALMKAEEMLGRGMAGAGDMLAGSGAKLGGLIPEGGKIASGLGAASQKIQKYAPQMGRLGSGVGGAFDGDQGNENPMDYQPTGQEIPQYMQGMGGEMGGEMAQQGPSKMELFQQALQSTGGDFSEAMKLTDYLYEMQSGGGDDTKLTAKQNTFKEAGNQAQIALDLLGQGAKTGIGQGVIGSLGAKLGFASSDQTAYRAAIANARTMIKSALLGSSMSASEMESLSGSIPNYSDPPSVAKQKLISMIQMAQSYTGQQESTPQYSGSSDQSLLSGAY